MRITTLPLKSDPSKRKVFLLYHDHSHEMPFEEALGEAKKRMHALKDSGPIYVMKTFAVDPCEPPRNVSASPDYILVFLVVATDARAEIHSVGVDIVRHRPDETIRVSLTSVVPEEAKKNITIAEAAKILRNVKGSGSVVFVGIIVHDVFSIEYLPILRAIAENGADIAFIDNDDAEPMKTMSTRAFSTRGDSNRI